MRHLKSTLIALLLASIVLATATGLLAGKADGRADFVKWSNRSARVLEPADYNTSGTCSCAICSWKGVQGIGNVGIGDGNVSLMKPGVLDSLVKGSTQAANSSESPGNANGEAIQAGNETAPSGNTNATSGPAQGAAEEAPLTESLYPDYDLAASVIPRYAPYSITINKPFEHILAENPTEAAALYGKLIGLPMPDGQVIDMGIKSIGYEY